jgi:hypothetical protein
MKIFPTVYGKIEGVYYLTTYKIGANSVMNLADVKTKGNKNLDINSELKFKPTILIRDPYDRFFSGLVQCALHMFTNRKHPLFNTSIPGDIYKSSFFARILNNSWYHVVRDPNLAPYHEFVYRYSNKHKLTVLDIKDWKPKKQTEELKHSNKERYPEIKKALFNDSIKPDVQQKIQEYLDIETHYYNLCKKGYQGIFIYLNIPKTQTLT